MQKGFLRNYCRTVYRGIIKYAKNYLREIIDEINVKSFKKYKYNFALEFVGSFMFVFLISIYMLNSNYNEEYIIRHTKQINPYKSDQIFVPGDSFFDDTLERFVTQEDTQDGTQGRMNMGSIMLERAIFEKIPQSGLNHGEDTVGVDSSDGELKDALQQEEEGGVEVDKEEATVEPKKDSQREESTAEPEKDSQREEPTAEPMIADVENVIFKDHVNEYSKIRISDINHINLENLQQYETLKDSKNRVNRNHSIYTFLGCLIYVTFVILGAHINPAYTYALWFIEPKKYGFMLTTLYVCFQYMGGILASILVAHMYGSIFIYSLLPKKRVINTFACETICTFILTLILISLYQYKKRYIKESNKGDSNVFHAQQIRNMASSSSLYEDMSGMDISDHLSRRPGLFNVQIENKQVKYIMNHIFYFIFIFCILLFFIFLTNTTLNPMFSTSTLYTYLYFKLFKTPGTLNIYAICTSFLSVSRIIQMIKMYIQSLPFWVGPYVGSTFASYCIQQFREEEEDEVIKVIDTNTYKYNTKKEKEKLPLINKFSFKQNAYLVEYHNHMNQHSDAYLAPAVF